MSENGTAYITITYQLRLYHRHQDWLLFTRQLYNQVVWHYYQILIKEISLLEQSNFLLLRALEEISVGTKEMRARGEEPLWKLTAFPKIPLYFRRAAITTAIGLARSYLGGKASQANTIDCSPVFYKGMYRAFREDSIQLKLYNGKKWVWVTYPYTGRKIPKEGKALSPTLKVEKKDSYLHVPVKLEVEDRRTVKERMETETQICAVAFPDSDSLAVCAIMEVDETLVESYFIHGGKAREAQRKRVLERLEKSKKSRQNPDRAGKRKTGERVGKLEEEERVGKPQDGKKVEKQQDRDRIKKQQEKEKEEKQQDRDRIEKQQDKEKEEKQQDREKTGRQQEEEKQQNRDRAAKENAVLYKSLEQINHYYAHKVSREILEYCKKKQIKLIVVPNYEGTIPLWERSYLNTNPFRWQGRAIIRNLKYKAFQEGILVTTIRPYHIADCCSECGRSIQRYNEGHKAGKNYYGGQLFFCPNGHKGNTALNTAKNIGRYFLRQFREKPFYRMETQQKSEGIEAG